MVTERNSSRDELRITEMRLARLSVLQELTAAALVLGDVGASVDEFLQHVSERMSFVAVLWIARNSDGCIKLQAAAGLSRRAREQRIECSQQRLVEVELPYPELSSDDIDCWSIALHGIDDAHEHCLRFYFVRETHNAPSLGALARRVTEMFQAAISHRALFIDLQEGFVAHFADIGAAGAHIPEIGP